jgi:plastocyanin
MVGGIGKQFFRVGLSILWVCGLAYQATAAEMRALVADSKGAVLSNAIVMLKPKFELSSPILIPEKTELRQQGALFVPFVLPVKTGTTVLFPNFDRFRHHVYSFSKAKRFELKLYGQDESHSVLFETAGVIALGCNIHDNMLAYVYVTDSPIFAKTDREGAVVFEDLEQGEYEVTAWHPGVSKNGMSPPIDIVLEGLDNSVRIQLELKRVWGQQSAPAGDEYEG